MTVNERLWEANLMEEYKKAIAQKNIQEIRTILKKVDLVDESIDEILKSKGLMQ